MVESKNDEYKLIVEIIEDYMSDENLVNDS